MAFDTSLALSIQAARTIDVGRGGGGSAPSSPNALWMATTDYAHANAGILQFSTSRVVLSSPGTATVYVERTGGFSGAVSCRVKTNSTTGATAMTAGTHFTAVDTEVSFADQEVGVKAVEVPVTSFPRAGLNMIVVTMDTAAGGVKLRNPEMQIYCDDGGVNPNATVFTGADSQTLEATVNSGTGGELYYYRDTAGVYTYNNRTSGANWGGYTFTNGGTQFAKTVHSAYPGETPIIDQQYAGTHDGAGNNTTGGFLADRSPWTIYRGFTITKCLTTGVRTFASIEGVIVENCNINNIANPADANTAYSGDLTRADNTGGIGLDGSIRSVMRYNTISEIYDPRTGTGLTNPFNATPYSLHSGIHGFNLQEPWIHDNTISIVNKGVFQKNPLQSITGFGHRVHDNLFSKISSSCFSAQVAGGGQQGALDNHFYYNLCDLSDAGCDSASGFEAIQRESDTSTQSARFWMYNNTQIGGLHPYRGGDVIDTVLYSNLIDDSTTYTWSFNGASAGGVNTSNVQYCNYNRIQPTPQITMQRDGAGEVQYTSLAAWQGAYPSQTQLQRDAATNSITSSPTYVNAAGADYRTSSGPTQSAGRFGRDIGIGNREVGA